MGKFAQFSLAILRNKLWHVEIQRNETNSSNSGTDNVNGNSDHSERGPSNRVLLPFSIEAILSAPHPSPTCSNLPEDISATENAERGDRGASNRVLFPFSIEAILGAPHPSPHLSLENFTRSNLPEDISATEYAERGMMKIQLLFKGLPRKPDLNVAFYMCRIKLLN